MKRENCKPGTKVFVQGMVLSNPDPSSHSFFHEVCPDCQPIVDKCLIEFEKAFPDEDEDA